MTSARTSNTISGAMQGASIGSNYGKWGTAIGGAVGAIGGLFKKKNRTAKQALNDEFAYNKALLKYQQDYNDWYTENQFTMLMNGAKKAGLHPFYGLANGHSPTSATISQPNYVGEESNEVSKRQLLQEAIIKGKQIQQDWSAKQAQIKLIDAQTQTENVNSLIKKAELVGNQLDNLSKRKYLNYQEKQYRAELEKNYKEINKTIEETTETQLRNEYNERRNRYLRNHPYLSELGFGTQHLKDAGNLSAKTLELILKTKTRGFKKGLK